MKNNYEADELKIDKEFSEIEKEITIQENFKSKYKLISVKELMAKEFAEIEWVVESLVPAQSTVAISGSPASFKTWVALELAIKISRGERLFGQFNTIKSNVLIVDEESGERLLKSRFQTLKSDADDSIFMLTLTNFKLGEDSVKELIYVIKEKNIKVLIFDSLVRIHGAEENDATGMAKIFGLIKKFNIEGITVILVHHNRKQGQNKPNPSQDMRGSSDILAALDCHLGISRNKEDESISVNQTKNRYKQELKPFRVNTIARDNSLEFEYAGEIKEIQASIDKCRISIIETLTNSMEPINKSEIIKLLKTNFSQPVIKACIKELIEEDIVKTKPGSRNSILCYVSEEGEF